LPVGLSHLYLLVFVANCSHHERGGIHEYYISGVAVGGVCGGRLAWLTAVAAAAWRRGGGGGGGKSIALQTNFVNGVFETSSMKRTKKKKKKKRKKEEEKRNISSLP
jgi:crotonobetainyl-CoA:carnitine CoA-transferase CaiB-like acyl-CoA transferase